MRADRLVSLVLLLRRHGRMSADTLARELEVSTRTVLRDVEALSAAGVPVYAERGRHGGFALLPGFRTELTGLNHDEALALVIAGSRRGAEAFGLGSALASAVLKVVDALPATSQDVAARAAERLLVDPDTDLLARRTVADDVPDGVAAVVRRAVLAGRRLRLRYAAAGQPPGWRTVDPVGLVTVRGRAYLLASRSGADRTYRLSRVLDAEVLDEPAQRPDSVDLEQAWLDRSARFRAGDDQVTVVIAVDPARRDELVGTAVAVGEEAVDLDGRLRVAATFQDARHAEWVVWQLGVDAEVLAPTWLRTALGERASAVADRHRATEGAAVPDRPEIVCICGSTRFLDEMRAVNRALTFAGVVVVAPGEADEPVTGEQKAALDALHLRKIDLADRVLVVNPGGYVGESTTREIAYARATGTPVSFTDAV